MKAKIVLVLLAALGLMSADLKDKPMFVMQEVMHHDGDVGSYSIPQVTVTKNGDILCFATARMASNDDWGNIQKVVLCRSTDGGKSWDAPRVIASRENIAVNGGAEIIDPDNGTIYYYGRKYPLRTGKGEKATESWSYAHPEEYKSLGGGGYCIYSKDERQTWSAMQDVDFPYEVMGTGIILQHGKYKGRWLLPGRITLSRGFDWNYMHNGVMISDDKGKTWYKGGLSQSHVGECTIVELSDGSIYLNNRNHGEGYGYRNHAISHDGGLTFTDFAVDTQLIDAVCHASLIRCTSPKKGNIILFANAAVKPTREWDSGARRNMSVWLSNDDAKTWIYRRTVNPGKSGYSDLAVAPDGTVYLAFETGESDPRENITVAHFNLAWVMEGERLIPLPGKRKD